MMGVVVFTDETRLNTNHQQIEVQYFDEPLYRSLGEVVGGHIEIVHPAGLPDPFVMVVNEEGLLHGLQINAIGCILYGTLEHGQPIVGNIVIMKEGFVDGEPYIVGLNDNDLVAVGMTLSDAVGGFGRFNIETEWEAFEEDDK